MKKKIQDIVHGKFEYETPCLLLPDNEAAFQVIEDELYEGSFSLRSSGGAVRGIVTCPNARVHCVDAAFDGTEMTISFTYDGGQLCEGDTDSGHFVITSNVGEYLLPFRAGITKHYLKTSIGKIKTLNDFTNLAKLNWEEALHIFQSPYFSNVFQEQSEFCSLLYKGITDRSNGAHEMEEFLIGIGKKRRNQFSIEEKERNYTVVYGVQEDTMVVKKSEWGYMEASISCDAPFVLLSKNRLQMYDFIGKHAEVTYQVDPRLMHGGKNYAVITVENCFQKEQIVVTALRNGVKPERPATSKKQALRYALVQKFVEYRLGHASLPQWGEEMQELLQRAQKLDSANLWYVLFGIYISFLAGETEKAKEALQAAGKNMRSQRTPMSAFYLYLTTMEEKNKEYEREVTMRIREVYLKYPGHPVLVWMLLQLDEALTRSPERKYQMLKKFMTGYSTSPVFYQEAAALLMEHPDLLYKSDAFENRLIYWMAKMGQLNEQVALRVLNLAQTKRQFESAFFRVLGRCYKLLQSNVAVKTICVYLIKMNRYGDAYFPWFRRGVEQHLKIAGLYEAYMLSWSKADGALPNEIIRYFSMNSALPARRKALLFSYVVRNRERMAKDWDAYMVLVKNFALRELEKGHMSEELAVIYETVKKQMPPEEWKAKKGEAESCYRVHISGERIAAIRVLQKESAVLQRVPASADGGYIRLYRRPFVILYEDTSGVIYAAKDTFRLRKMMSGEHIYAPELKQEIPASVEETTQKQLSLHRQLEAFAGSLEEMETLITQAASTGMEVLPYWEQLFIRMLFSGKFLPGHERLFEIIGKDADTVSLRDAYVSWFSWKYMTEDQPFSEAAFSYIGESVLRKHYLNKYCEIAFLRFFTEKPKQRWQPLAEQLLQKNLFAGNYYSFYEQLPEELQRKYLLFHVQVISYRGKPGAEIYAESEKKEQLRECLPGIYTLPVDLFPDEEFSYRIIDAEGELLEEDKKGPKACDACYAETRYGKLSGLFGEIPDRKAQYAYAEYSDLTEVLFVPTEE